MADESYWSNLARLRRGHISRRRLLVSGTGAGLSAAFLAACGGSNNNGTKATVTAPATQAAIATRAATPSGTAPTVAAPATSAPAGGSATAAAAAGGPPKRGGAIVYDVPGEQPNQDPHLTTGSQTVAYGPGVVYSKLIRYKVGPDVSARTLIPDSDMAASWEQPDDSTYVFHMRPNIKWHNVAPVNGRLATSQDIVYSWQRSRDLKVTAGFLPPMSSVTAPDNQTVRVQTPTPDADFLVTLAAGFNVIVAKEAVDLHGDLKEGPNIGTGAWIFKNFVVNNTVQFVRNPDYFRMAPDGKPLPYGDSLEILRILDASTSLAAFRTKKTLFKNVTPTDHDTLAKENPQIQYRQEKYYTGTSVVLKSDQPPFNDPRVRQAVNMSINRQEVRDSIFGGLGWLGGTIVNAETDDQLISDDDVNKAIPYDVNAAKQLIDQAGLKPQSITLYTSASGTAFTELVLSDIKPLGFTGNVVAMDFPTLISWFTNHDKPFVVLLRGAKLYGVSADFRGSYKTGGAYNTAVISDSNLDQLIEAQAAEFKDAAKRAQLIQNVERRILELQGTTPLIATIARQAYYPNVHGLSQIYQNADSSESYEYIWLD